MANIRTIPESEATGPLAKVYKRMIEGYGSVANILKSMSLSPPTLEHCYNYYLALMHGPQPLSRAQRELIAVAVSQTNECHY